jgi:formamidopyrimidine-DNA glycosylase
MPELAEVEYFRKQWDVGIGDNVRAVRLHGEKRIFRGTNVAALKRHLSNKELHWSKARGKQMLFVFASGERERSGPRKNSRSWLGIHLGMSGRLRVEATNFRAGKHDHLLLQQTKRTLVFTDARQFGRVRFHYGEDAPAWWETGAPEIVSRAFTLAKMREFVIRHGRAPIKAVLLLQSGFPGIGNWMADEILWRARIAPDHPGRNVTTKQLAALWRSTRFVARESLRTIGHDNSDPPKGWLMHNRWTPGRNCPRDGHKLRRATIGGRTTVWCPECQR